MGYEGAPLRLCPHWPPPVPDERCLPVPAHQTLAAPVTTDVPPMGVTREVSRAVSTLVQIQLLHPGETTRFISIAKTK